MKVLRLLMPVLVVAVASVTASAQVIPNQYIVVLNDRASNPENTARAIVNQYGGSTGHIYRNAIQGFVFHGSDAAAQAIARNPNVAYVESDLEAHAIGQTLVSGVDRTEADLSVVANIDGIDQPLDVDIAVIDTGIDIDHPDLPPVVGGRHFYTISSGRPSDRGSYEDNNYDDDNGHGTHVAGTIAALDNDIGVVGVAPGSRLWAVKVLDAAGSGSFGDVIKGVDFVTANADQIDVANMSLGGQGLLNSLRTAIQNSVAAGVVYVVAAGNESRDVYGTDGILGTSDDSLPASYPEVAAVSAMGDTDGKEGGNGPNTSRATADDTFADFTNYSRYVVAENPVVSPGAAIDVAGPGVDILSTIPGGGYDSYSGTSMAAPHVAGLVALEILANGRAINSNEVAEIRQAIIDSAQSQADWRSGDTYDSDNNEEGLALAINGQANEAPLPSITGPTNGSDFVSGAVVTLSGIASDFEDGDLTSNLQWSSSIDGDIGTGGSVAVSLSDGEHNITASVTDSGGKTRSDSITILIGDPPDVATEVIVGGVSYSTEGGKNQDKNLLITVSIEDNLGVSVSGASVSITLYRNGSTSGSGTASTGSDGTVTFQLRNASAGCYTTDVTNVSASGLTYDGAEPSNEFCK